MGMGFEALNHHLILTPDGVDGLLIRLTALGRQRLGGEWPWRLHDRTLRHLLLQSGDSSIGEQSRRTAYNKKTMSGLWNYYSVCPFLTDGSATNGGVGPVAPLLAFSPAFSTLYGLCHVGPVARGIRVRYLIQHERR